MDLRRLPNLNALKIFEVASRKKSFSQAAEELFITHSAVSHQIRLLESQLGMLLFHRDGRRVTLTENGFRYAEKIRSALTMIAEASESLTIHNRENQLIISLLPSFAARWLMPRIGGFIESFPELNIEIQSNHTITDFSRDNIDVVLRLGDGNYPGLFVEHLLDEAFFPACSPTFNHGHLPKKPAELANFTLLRNDYEMWTAWFTAAGLDGWQEPSRGALYQDASQQMQAIIDDQGIGLVRQSLAMQEIMDGKLIQLFDIKVQSSLKYWFVCPEPLKNTFRVRMLREWLHEEVKKFQLFYNLDK